MKKNAQITVLLLLLLVAAVGILLRQAPITGWLPAPYDNIRHSLNHLAFLGWAWGAISLGLVEVLTGGRWNRPLAVLFGINMALSLVLTFLTLLYGYGKTAIALLGVHTAISILFFILLGFQIRRHEGISGVPERRAWRWASTLFVISALGPLMIPVVRDLGFYSPYFREWAVNFYLHFHYDGWLVLIWLSLWFGLRAQYGLAIPKRRVGWMAVLLTAGALFSLGLPYQPQYPALQKWNLLGGLLRVIAASLLVVDWRRSGARQMRQLLPPGAGWALATGMLLFFVRELLQWLAAWPFLDRWLSPAIPELQIVYLQLLFLGVITPFLLIFFYAQNWLKTTQYTRWGWRIYWIGFIVTNWYLVSAGWRLPKQLWPVPPMGMFIGSIAIFTGLLMQIPGLQLRTQRMREMKVPAELSDV